MTLPKGVLVETTVNPETKEQEASRYKDIDNFMKKLCNKSDYEKYQHFIKAAAKGHAGINSSGNFEFDEKFICDASPDIDKVIDEYFEDDVSSIQPQIGGFAMVMFLAGAMVMSMRSKHLIESRKNA